MFQSFYKAFYVAVCIATSMRLKGNGGAEAICNSPPKSVKNALKTSYAKAPYNFGDTFVYSCVDPLHVISPNITECLHDGTWSLDNYLPSCTLQRCGPPPRVGRVTFQPVKKAYNVGETVTYSCVATYASNQTATKSTCSMIDFQPYWDLKDLPECVSVCQIPERIANAEIYGPKPPYFSGATVMYKCKGVFNLNIPQTEATSTCQSDRSWSRSSSLKNLPVCYCSVPPTIANGKHKPEGPYLPGHVIIFSCFDGYKLQGELRQVCQSNGDWLNAKFPKCIKTEKPTKPLHLRCYKCDWKSNPYCYYATHKRLISYEDCSFTNTERAYCESRFVVKEGAVVEATRGCKYATVLPGSLNNLTGQCKPKKWSKVGVECTFPCVEPQCNTISANELRPCPTCPIEHAYCDHRMGECKCTEDYTGPECRFYIRSRQKNKNLTEFFSNNSRKRKEKMMAAQKSDAVHLLPSLLCLALSLGLLLR